MAKPVECEHKTVTLKIHQGPSMHGIEHCFLAPDYASWGKGVFFRTAIPVVYENRSSPGTEFIELELVIVEARRFDEDRFVIGCFTREEFSNQSPTSFPKPTVNITNYSTGNRAGFMEVSNAFYRKLVSEI